MEFDKYISQSKEVHCDKYEYISLYRDDANQKAMIIINNLILNTVKINTFYIKK